MDDCRRVYINLAVYVCVLLNYDYIIIFYIIIFSSSLSLMFLMMLMSMLSLLSQSSSS